MKRYIANYRGFTLAELLVSIAIIGLVLAGITGVFSAAIPAFRYTADQGANLPSSRNAIHLISNEIRNALAISSPAYSLGATTTGAVLDYTASGASSRRIAMGTGADANTILISDLATGTVLSRMAPGRALSITFNRDGTDKRKVSVALVLKNPAEANAADTRLTTTVTTLNTLP